MIVLRSAAEIEKMRTAGTILAHTLERVRKAARAGITTAELDAIAAREITRRGGLPAFKGYRGYPANICTSVNEVVVHGIPSQRVLTDGDIISFDIGVRHNNYYADAAITIGVGRISETAERLMRVTEEALQIGIANARVDNRIGDLSASIQKHVEENGFSVVRALVGHGIGTELHEDPEVPNYRVPGRNLRIEAGMVIAIEPMVNEGSYDVETLDDGWTVVTADRALSAHFEHTVAILKDGPAILTLP